MTEGIKNVSIKRVGGQVPIETLAISPGTTTRDILQTIGCGNGFQLCAAQNPDIVFGPNDNVYARVADGDLLHCSALVDAGRLSAQEVRA